jgi:hypothetical protein
MAKFLNTDLLNEWIPRLIRETKKELIIIVPYIKTSDRIYSHLFEADKRGVETTLVYRENKLSELEKKKLASLDNLNLLCHPNVHAKCYYNEQYMIIGSMNLYEYSERNNREMGVLLHREDLNEFRHDSDNQEIFEEAIHEIRTIINASSFEKHSRETKTEGFEMDIIKTEQERVEEYCRLLNKVFVHKRFVPVGQGTFWAAVCKNYFDRIDLTIEHRAVLRFTYEEERIERIFKKFTPHYHEYRFEGYKFYWDHHKAAITLYKDQKHHMWSNISEMERLELVKNGIDQLITFLRPFIS